MALAPGARLGPYEIVLLVGAGGMGEVYRARDPKLNRLVALKVLPAHTAADPDRRARLAREAQTIAVLSHPNIVTIYSVEEADGVLFLTMELIEGKPLSDLIVKGGLPLSQVLTLAIPLADAIGAAHQKGIMHRDLKPSNVMVATDGRVKVLDFGLAKLEEEAVQFDGTVGPTTSITAHGQIVGTVAYMSPEQASAGVVDHRSDLFSFGVLLYEMSTGVRPFKGESSVSVLASILKDAPRPIVELRPELPRDLARIVRRALAKDAEQRYQTAKDLRNDLQTLKDDLTSGDLSVAKRKRGGVIVGAVALATAIVTAAVVCVIVLQRATSSTGSTVSPTLTRMTATGKASLAAISPDGKYIVHVVDDGGYSLWIRQTATASNVQIVPPSPDRYVGLTFSPDGDYIYFTRFEGRTQSNVYRVPALGGTPQPVLRDVDSPPSFSPDGSRFAFLRGYPGSNEVSVVLARADGSGGPVRLATRPLIGGYPLFTRAAWSPDGRTIAVAAGAQMWIGGGTAAGTTVVGIDVASGRQRPLAPNRWDSISNLAWLADGSLVISGTEQGRPNNQISRLMPDATIRRLTNDLNTYVDIATAARQSSLVAVLGDSSSTISASAPGEPALHRTVTSGAGRYDGQTGLVWTPDNRLVFTSAAGGQIDLWIIDADGKNGRQLTSDAATERMPAVTLDGRSVVFVATRNDQPGIWRLDLASGSVTRVTDGANDVFPQCLPDNHTIVFTRMDGEPRMYQVGIEGGTPAPLSDVRAMSMALSPDARSLASPVFDPAAPRIGILPLAVTDLTLKFDIMNAPIMVAWTSTGDALTFLESRKGPQALWNQSIDGGAPRLLLDLHGHRIFNFAWSRDGRLAVAHGPEPTDVV